MSTTTTGPPAATNTPRRKAAASTTATTSTNNSPAKPPSNPAPKYATRQILQKLFPSARAVQIFIGLAGLILGIKWADQSCNLSRWTELIWQTKSDVVGIARHWLEMLHRSESTGFLLALRSLEVPHVVTKVLGSYNWLSILIFLFSAVRTSQNYCLQNANQSKDNTLCTRLCDLQFILSPLVSLSRSMVCRDI